MGILHLRSPIAAMDNAAIEHSCGIVSSQGVGIELRKTALANLERLVTLAIGQFGPEALLWTLLASIVNALPLEEEITMSLIGAHPQETGVLALAELLARLEILIDRVTSALVARTRQIPQLALDPLRVLNCRFATAPLPTGNDHWCSMSLKVKMLIERCAAAIGEAVDLSTAIGSYTALPHMDWIKALVQQTTLVKALGAGRYDETLSNLWAIVCLPLSLVRTLVGMDTDDAEGDIELDWDCLPCRQLNISFSIEGAVAKLAHWVRQTHLEAHWQEAAALVFFRPTKAFMAPIAKNPSFTGGLSNWHNQSYVPATTLMVATDFALSPLQRDLAFVVELGCTVLDLAWAIHQDAIANPIGFQMGFTRSIAYPKALRDVFSMCGIDDDMNEVAIGGTASRPLEHRGSVPEAVPSIGTTIVVPNGSHVTIG